MTIRAEKDVPIQPSPTKSRHIVDLTSFSSKIPKGPRPALDFWQRINILLHPFKRNKEDHRAILPFYPNKKKPRASIIGFLKLPFALLALAFKK